MLNNKQVRLAAGVRLVDMARETGVSRTSVALYEANVEAIKDACKRGRLADAYRTLREKLGQ